MIEGLPTIGPADRPQSVRKVTTSSPLSRAGGAPDLSFPDTPPAEVLEALGQAQSVISELASRELHFSIGEADGRVHVRVLDGNGDTVREIPAKDALEILSGERPVGLGVDALG
ncbi:MAG: flagellar protein FlaG [Gaiellales bacterium]